MVEIKNLTKYYGKNCAIKEINFEIQDNEILGFLGPNGAGKSTTMNIISGYLPSTNGTVIIDGYDIAEQPSEAKKRIGYLPEIPPVYPDMRVEEYLKFVAGIKGVPSTERKEQIQKAMERLRIVDMRHRLIRNLSKGYKQRVGFAQALLGNPKILILDEPTVGLDPTQVIEVRNLIMDLKKDHSIIFSSHILAEVSAVCERVVIINKGKIMAIDTIDNLEQSMTSGSVVKLKVEGNKDKVLRLLKDIRAVGNVSDINYVSTNVYTYQVDLKDESGRNEIMQTLLSNRCNLLEITAVRLNLEQVFLKITSRAQSGRTSLKDLLTEEEFAKNSEQAQVPENPYDTVQED